MRLVFVPLICAVTLAAQEGLYQFSIQQDRLAGAPNFSFLNRPIEPADRLFVRDGHFFRVGRDLKPNTADDERVRLFGVNLAFGANFPEEADAVRLAKRFRRLGINLVRLHHMDSSPDAEPENCRSILTTGPYPTLNPIAVRRLRAFINAMRAEGVYINLNLHVGYRFRPDVDRVPDVEGGIPTQSKPLHIFFPRMVELQKVFTTKVLEALALKDDPVLAMVEINNETSLLEAWQRGNLERRALGEYEAELRRQWSAFLKAKYGNEEAVQRAWGVAPGGSLESGTVPIITVEQKEPVARVNDWLLFLVDRDRFYLKEMLAAIRAGTNALVPVTGTQVNFSGLLHYDSHQDMDYQDSHFYIDHYNFPNRSWDGRDWRIRDASAVGTGLTQFLNMAAAREYNRPYTVSEFNQNWPNRHAAEIDPALAVFAAFQDWDSIMHFAYSHGREWDKLTPGGFDLNGDWTKYPAFRQAAWLFRTAAIQPGEKLIRIAAPLEARLRAARERRVGNIAGSLQATVAYDPAIAFLHRVAITRDGGEVPQLKAAPPYRSDTGQLVYDPNKRLLSVAAPAVAGVFGFLGTSKGAAGDLEVTLAPSSRGFAAILLTALDGKPIRASRRMLLTNPGYTLSSLPGSPPRPQKLIPYQRAQDWWTLEPEPGSSGPSGSRNGGEPPTWMERIECRLFVRSNAAGMSVYPLDGAGARMRALPQEAVRRTENGFEIHLQADGQDFSPWYEITTEP